MIRDDATERQVRAARPGVSTWLAANAGSGKTRVLTDRVARLLLDGVRPENILCLTYTKAAAAEMQNRLFDRLGKWAMMQDQALQDELNLLGSDQSLTKPKLANARTLFASAIEAPGGLKIQTIHAFCAGLLRRFPVEAGVSPLFTEMEERAADLLREDIVGHMAASDPKVVENLALHLTDEDFEAITSDGIRHRDLFAHAPDADALRGSLGLPLGLDEETVADTVFGRVSLQDLADLAAALEAGSSNDQKAAARLRAITHLNGNALALLEGVLLTGKGAKEPFSAKLGSFPTKATRDAHPGLMAWLEPLMTRVQDMRPHRLGMGLLARSLALHAFGHDFLRRYEAAKSERGWLDFDDLINRARDLLSDPKVASWVLYRLDGRIDHVLVDEAQDTSPAQWQVIERLTQEFTSGSGARDVPRTVFVVGDKKQSIYSFQGAAPGEFDRMREDFAERYKAIGQPFERTTLEHSFRSADTILRLVDETFADHAAAGFAEDEKHRAFKDRMPGRVDLWPPVEKDAEAEELPWYDPTDRIADADPTHRLADMIADQLGDMIGRASIPAEIGRTNTYEMRRVQAGDILILVQRRGPLFHEIIRACKQAGLPLAGADRLKVGAELAVRDLGALLTALATPEDDLALACALRSPLFGFAEDDLFRLANPRKGYLIEAMRADPDRYAGPLAIWTDLAARTDFLRPYDLIERILTRHKGRLNLLARLGDEAEDGIDALLAQALAYERENVPSLTGFLRWMETDDLTIKRQADGSGGLIRVMTVHGAKGLEAPIVILPDTAKRDVRPRGAILKAGSLPIWRSRADDAPPMQTALSDAERQAEQAERERLLYVAMTRAECWLIVAAAGDLGKDGLAWHDRVSSAMARQNALPRDFGPTIGMGLRLEHGDWKGKTVSDKAKTDPVAPILDDIYRTSAPPYLPPPAVLSPSDLGGPKALAGALGQTEEEALIHGSLVHLALEHLAGLDAAEARALWPRVADLFDGAPDAQQLALALDEALTILGDPALSSCFAPETLAEVPVSAWIEPLGHRIHGVIDRLLITDDRILAVDFKTNTVVPGEPGDVPAGLMRQMGAYACALGALYPDRPVDTAILWTASPRLMMLPHDMVMDALNATTLP